MPIYGVIIAGGRGKRFWPQSRIRRPKYLLKLSGQKRTLLQGSVYRLKGLIKSENIIVVTNKLQYSDVRKQLPQIPKGNIIPEPMMKNTAAAVGVAAAIINKKDSDAIIVVVPADQLVKNEKRLKAALKKAAHFAKSSDSIVTIGIKPTFPATGFGYIKIGRKAQGNIFKAEKFIEKPDIKKANILIKNKNYLWNSGIFIFKNSLILKEIKRYMPKLAKGLRSIRAQGDLNRCYRGLSDISIDYGIMEKSRKVYVVKANLKWHDIGSWMCLYDIMKPDRVGNIVMGANSMIDTKNSILISNKKHLIGTIGLDNIIVIHTEDATLVCGKNKLEAVKDLVSKMDKKNLRKFL